MRENAEGLAIPRSPGVKSTLRLASRSTCEEFFSSQQQDIKRVGICRSSANFPAKIIPGDPKLRVELDNNFFTKFRDEKITDKQELEDYIKELSVREAKEGLAKYHTQKNN
ncbi:uncharacterized protein OCT59_028738 [Rhizophagus irregularis]|uniref:uncharacterized protein n=1 Tax=Rhizophagus irregularis TaxID=588596 RepID=UPI00331E72EE|nr:hypothetical protein OCT59_028738 [Rhizophagus irregularis]